MHSTISSPNSFSLHLFSAPLTLPTLRGFAACSIALLTLAVCLSAPLTAQSDPAKPAAERETRFGVPVIEGPMDTVLLKNYEPKTSLVVPVTDVPKARFPVIDVHTHTSQGRIRTKQDVDDWVRTMDEVGVEYTVVFTGAHGDRFQQYADLFRHQSKRFQLYCSLYASDVTAADYPQKAAAEIERCYKMGARGIGEVTDKGSGIQRDTLPRQQRLHFDDARLDLAWQACARLKIPVNFHIADHPSAWQPLGPNQERSPVFQTYNQHGKDVLSHAELLASRDRLLERHPKTTFIACHFSNQGHDMASLAKVMDRFPGLYLDLSARDYEIGRQPRTAAKFLTKYKDRVLFGTDMERDAAMYRGWWRLLETDDEFIQGRIWWRHYGLNLPDDVLKAIYHDNAKRVLNWQPW